MSPVSRGRGKKNRSAKGPRGRRAPVRSLTVDPGLEPLTRPSGPRPRGIGLMPQARAWWPASHAQILDDATTLLECTGPTELEEAVCSLIGEHWQHMQELHSTGFAPSGWLDGLLAAAEERAGEPGVRRLLRGIAVTAGPEPAAAALKLLATSRSLVADDATQEPAWLDAAATVTVSPDVQLLRDAFGLRFGLLAQVTTGDAPARTYLFDVDLCHGYDRVVRCGYHADVPAATAAWRSVVGASADHAEPEPLPAGLLRHLLSNSVFDGPFASSPSGQGFRELFRADRIAYEAIEARYRAGDHFSWPKDIADEAQSLADTLTAQFRTWAAGHDVDLPPADGPDDDVVRWLLGDWVSPGLTEELALACSPHRIAAITAYLNDDWQTDVRDQALAVLPVWVRYCLERSGLPGPAAEHALAWARRAADDPRTVGSDHGDHPDRAVDETTPTELHL